MKGYVVCVYKSITSDEKLKEYAVKAKTAVEKYKGKFLIRGGKTTTNEGESSPRTVVIEFPSYDEANIFYNSKIHSLTKNKLPSYNAILSSIYEGVICDYEASLSIEKKWLKWLLNHKYTIENVLI